MISRAELPQIPEHHKEKFIEMFRNEGVFVRKKTVPVQDLKLTQSEINKTKVWKLMQIIRNNETKNKKMSRIIISKDNFVLDGSHRMVAQLNIDVNSNIEVWKIDLPIKELVQRSKNFMFAEYRTISDNTVADRHRAVSLYTFDR